MPLLYRSFIDIPPCLVYNSLCKRERTARYRKGRVKSMEQQKEPNYADSWLEKRKKSKPEPDDDFLTMLNELSRGPQ